MRQRRQQHKRNLWRWAPRKPHHRPKKQPNPINCQWSNSRGTRLGTRVSFKHSFIFTHHNSIINPCTVIFVSISIVFHQAPLYFGFCFYLSTVTHRSINQWFINYLFAMAMATFIAHSVCCCTRSHQVCVV